MKDLPRQEVRASMEEAQRQLYAAGDAPLEPAAPSITDRILDEVRARPVVWLGAAAVAGFTVAKLATRRRSVVSDLRDVGRAVSLAGLALRVGSRMAAPILVEVGRKKLVELLQTVANPAQGAPAAPPPTSPPPSPNTPI